MHGLSIGKLARAANVSIDTIRFYEKSGLLPQPARRPSGFREYSELDLRQLTFVRRARLLGFPLEEIVELLKLDDDRNSAIASRVIEQKLSVIDRKIVELQHWRSSLRELMHDHADRTPARSILDFFDNAATDVDETVEESTQAALRDSHDKD